VARFAAAHLIAIALCFLAPAPAPGQPSARLRIPAADIASVSTTIEDPSGAMRPFYRRLRAVAERRRGAVARIAVWGTSDNASDMVTQAMRHALARRFGDGGKGFVPIAPGWPVQFHRDVEWAHRSFATSVVNRNRERSGRYGLGGVLASSSGPAARATFGTVADGPVNRAVSRFVLFHQAFPGGAAASLTVDGGAPEVVPTGAPAVEDRVHEVRVPDGPHRLTVSGGDGPLRLYGVVMERDGPGVVVDGLMLVGAFTRVLLHFDAAHIATQVRQREPDLLLVWLGANDAVSESVPYSRDEHVRIYSQVLERLRAGRPDASCLVASVLDKGERSPHGGLRTRPRVPDLVSAQRAAASRAGCAFYDAFTAMGGEGSVVRWYRASPRLVTGDLTHLTAAGAAEAGGLFERAILKGYDDWLGAGG
jgi:hypothetical protein